MLTLTKKGLYCQAGNFYIDPSGAVENAVITHAHSDHARRGSQNYFCTQSGLGLLRARIGKNIRATGISYSETFSLGPVKLSFHPAGHILGSAQVRMEHLGEVWVASGDYKRESDPTCEHFEVVPCDVFVTEATFGTPSYIWKKDLNVGLEIYEWWQENARLGINSVLFAYSLGKTQRILGVLEPYAQRPVLCHGAAAEINGCYLAAGVKLARHRDLDEICDALESGLSPEAKLRGELMIAPQSFLKTEKARFLGQNFRTAFASGWMATRSTEYGQELHRGFVMSDHADWNDLLQTIKETRAKRVYVQHRGHGALVRHLKNLGLHAYPDSDLIAVNPNQLSLL